MFERKSGANSSANTPAQIRRLTDRGEPVEFVYNGARFHINQILTHWLQTNNWWQSLEDQTEVEDEVIKFWQVEAAPIGAITTFEIEFNQGDNSWQIRPSSRVNSRNKK
ncbi:MAG: DUF6504 family protein [Candidatus Nanopelagicus sp.]